MTDNKIDEDTGTKLAAFVLESMIVEKMSEYKKQEILEKLRDIKSKVYDSQEIAKVKK